MPICYHRDGERPSTRCLQPLVSILAARPARFCLIVMVQQPQCPRDL